MVQSPPPTSRMRWLPKGWKGDGVIARVGFPELAAQLKSLRVPVVNVSGIELPRVRFPRVASDQSAAAEMAAHADGHGDRDHQERQYGQHRGADMGPTAGREPHDQQHARPAHGHGRPGHQTLHGGRQGAHRATLCQIRPD